MLQSGLVLVVTTGFSKLKVPLGLLLGAFYLMGRMWRSLLQPGQQNSGTLSVLTPSRMWWNVSFGPRELSASSKCARAPVRCRCHPVGTLEASGLPSTLPFPALSSETTYRRTSLQPLMPGPQSVTPAQLIEEQLNFPLVLVSRLPA